MRRLRLLSAAFLTIVPAALLPFAACSEPPDPSYILDRPRILAIRAEPPALVPDGQVTLDALVYTPPGSPEPEYEWSWCASLGSTQQCATSAEVLAAVLERVSLDGGDGDRGPIPVTYPIGTGPSVPFSYPVPSDVAEAFCEASRPDSDLDAGDDEEDSGADAGTSVGLSCRRDSWTAYVMLTVKVGDRTLSATRELTAHFTTPSSLNANPSVLGVRPFTSPLPTLPPLDAGEDAEAGTDTYAEADAAIGASLSGSVVIVAAVPESAAELWETSREQTSSDGGADADADAGAGDDDAGMPGPPSDGGAPPPPDGDAPRPPTRRYERLSIAWYVERGTLASGTTSLEGAREDVTARDWTSLLVNRWSPEGSGPVELILVVRDERGGIGWVRQRTQQP